MKKVEMNLHEGHRKRLQNRYKTGGADGLSDHNLLELLLFYSIPRKDTNELAHRLISAFGSLNGVFDATYNELLKIEGMGENSAMLISSVPAICRRYEEGISKGKINLSLYIIGIYLLIMSIIKT